MHGFDSTTQDLDQVKRQRLALLLYPVLVLIVVMTVELLSFLDPSRIRSLSTLISENSLDFFWINLESERAVLIRADRSYTSLYHVEIVATVYACLAVLIARLGIIPVAYRLSASHEATRAQLAGAVAAICVFMTGIFSLCFYLTADGLRSPLIKLLIEPLRGVSSFFLIYDTALIIILFILLEVSLVLLISALIRRRS